MLLDFLSIDFSLDWVTSSLAWIDLKVAWSLRLCLDADSFNLWTSCRIFAMARSWFRLWTFKDSSLETFDSMEDFDDEDADLLVHAFRKLNIDEPCSLRCTRSDFFASFRNCIPSHSPRCSAIQSKDFPDGHTTTGYNGFEKQIICNQFLILIIHLPLVQLYHLNGAQVQCQRRIPSFAWVLIQCLI